MSCVIYNIYKANYDTLQKFLDWVKEFQLKVNLSRDAILKLFYE